MYNQKFYKILEEINKAQMDICEDMFSIELDFVEQRTDCNDYQYTIYHHAVSGKFIKIKERLVSGCDGTERYFQWAKEANQTPTTTYEYEEKQEPPCNE